IVATLVKVVRCGSSPEDRPLTLPVLMSSLVVPPASGVNTSFDSPKEPWHEAHFSSNSSLPRSTLPLPLGRRLKSGRTSMSQAFTSAGVAARPTPLKFSKANPAVAAPLRARARIDLENLDIGDLPAFDDFPGLDGVVVIDGLGAAHLAQLTVARLDIAGFVDGPRLQDGRRTVPYPVDVEAGQRLVLDRPFEARGLPVDATVEGDIDLLDAATTRPGEARNVEEALFDQGLAARRGGDDRLALLDRAVLAMQAVRQQVDVMHGLVLGGIRLVADFDAAQPLDPGNALDARHDEAQWVAVFRAQHFAVLAVGNEDLAGFDHFHRNRTGHRRTVGALGQHVAGLLVIDAAILEQGLQRHAGEFRAGQHAVRVLHGRYGDVAPFQAGVGAAFDEVDARHGRQAHQFIHGVDLRLLQEL